MTRPSWIERLKQRWNLGSTYQMIVILIVFACTGFTILFLKKPLLRWLAGNEGDTFLATMLYYVFVLPLYNILLLGYGFIFGQFNFFWQFETRFFQRITSKWKKPK